MILQHETEQTHLLSDILARPECSCDTDPPGETGSTAMWTFTWKGSGLYSEWVKQAAAVQTGNWKMGPNLKLHFLVHNKTEAQGNLLWYNCRCDVVFSHAGEKTTFESLGDHIIILQSACH